mmetsp:Transcript_6/g.7  ORF Transcript_6/g.7 Transcript_6/m.7 type:complete len:408 (-) Transcript_6:71-1294(-)|eukprot:CAMPEP_0194219134 /NCGR_PEP_ID=MMETSP0156-20130528/25282_1 /TAXON_ID=33649 /ORGANISM="Thalassionema nitzschioides, Strain L26-B" /LENGTH=407 /DNA_ID=CAMNT_0038948699 /DNA_START=75 /DNA_END=1298 /DNA_ORIENTATION=+
MAPLPNQVSDDLSHEKVIKTRGEEIVGSDNELLAIDHSSNEKGKAENCCDKSQNEEVSLGDILGLENDISVAIENRRSSMSDFDEAKRQNAVPNNFDDSWGECIIGDLPSELTRSNSDSWLGTAENKESKHLKKKKKAKLSFLKRGKKNKKSVSLSNNNDDDCSISSEVSFSSVYSGCSTSSDYQGPRPVGKDGKALKSCMKKQMSDSDSLDSVEGDDASSVASSASKRSISFSKVEIRDYDRAVGDNPCVSSGAPLSLDWNYREAAEHDLEEYENFKESNGGGRSRSEMQMPASVRTKVLAEFGATAVDIRRASKEATIVKRGRIKTMNKKNDIIDKTKGKLKEFCSAGRDEERQQELLWEKAHKGAVEKYLTGDTSVVAPSNQVSEEDIKFISLSIETGDDVSEE